MTKRAYSPRDIRAKKYKTLPWGEEWSGPFGCPTLNETWFISGASASGKSSFVMQLSKELCKYGGVLYLSYEEGISCSFRDRLLREKMDEVQGRFRVVTDDTLSELYERLRKPRSAHFVVVDSFQYTNWSYDEVHELVTSFPKKSFIFISQEYKSQPLGKAAARLKYMAGIKVRVMGFRAFCQGRFTGDAGSFYTVWEEGLIRTNNGLSLPQ